MQNLVDFYKNLPEDKRNIEKLSNTFINFYLYFKRLQEKRIITNEIIHFLDTSLDFSKPIFSQSSQTRSYLNAKQFQIEQFLEGIKTTYDKFSKDLKRTFEIPNKYSYEQVCDLIEQSYLAYASLRYQKNVLISEKFEQTFIGDKVFYKTPEYIPDTNANINDILELVSGIKQLSIDGKTYEWFNVFNDDLHIRAIIDISDGQIILLYVNGEKYEEVPISFIKKLKQQIKKFSSKDNNKSKK